MGTQGKRLKIYQITNNMTDDVYVGSTSEALYRRLYRHKCDAKKGISSKLCNLMRSLGLDKFKIDMVEEGVFADADAVRAREKALIRERGCTLNDEATTPTSTPQTPSGEQTDYTLRITELEQIVAKLRTQVQTIAAVAQAKASTSSASARSVSSSDGTPQTFNMSVDDDEAEEPPNDTPEYDITDTRFGVLKGKVDDNLNELLNSHYRKAQSLGKHLKVHPKDKKARDELVVSKELMAKKIARLRYDSKRIGLDKPCLRLFEAIEKETGINKKMQKQAQWYVRDYRKKFSFEDEYGSDYDAEY